MKNDMAALNLEEAQSEVEDIERTIAHATEALRLCVSCENVVDYIANMREAEGWLKAALQDMKKARGS